MTARKRPVKIEPRQDHIIKKQYIPDWLKFWKRTPKPKLDHNCNLYCDHQQVMIQTSPLKDVNAAFEIKDATFFHNETKLVIKWENPNHFVEWLQEVLAVKKWKNRAEQEYFLKFEFAEVLE